MKEPKSKEALTDKVNYSEQTKAQLSGEETKLINMLADKEPSCYADIAAIMIEYADQQSTSLTTALKERDDEIKRLRELFNIVFNIDGMTTSEFCAEYLIELPSWRGDVLLAASEFIRIDAIKWKMVKDAAKEIWNTPIALTTQNGKDNN